MVARSPPLVFGPVRRTLRTTEFDTFDMEWTPGTYDFRCAVIRRWDGTVEQYTTMQAFIEGLFDRERPGILYAHNAGKSDLLMVLEQTLVNASKDKTRKLDFDLRISCNTPIIAEVTEKAGGESRKWVIRDSVRTWVATLAEIGKTIGRKKFDDWECTVYSAAKARDGGEEQETDDEAKKRNKLRRKQWNDECGHEKCIFYARIDVLGDVPQSSSPRHEQGSQTSTQGQTCRFCTSRTHRSQKCRCG